MHSVQTWLEPSYSTHHLTLTDTGWDSEHILQEQLNLCLSFHHKHVRGKIKPRKRWGHWFRHFLGTGRGIWKTKYALTEMNWPTDGNPIAITRKKKITRWWDGSFLLLHCKKKKFCTQKKKIEDMDKRSTPCEESEPPRYATWITCWWPLSMHHFHPAVAGFPPSTVPYAARGEKRINIFTTFQ